MSIGQGLLGLAALDSLAAVGFQRNLCNGTVIGAPWSTVLLVSHGAHTLALACLTYELGHLPFASMGEALSSLAWLLVGLYVLLGSRWKVEVVGTVAAPAAFVMTAFSALVIRGSTPAREPLVYLHVTMLVASYAAFCLAGICALLYFVQARMLKKKRLSGAFQLLPSLDRLDRVAYRFILAGFPLLVLGIAITLFINTGPWAWDAQKVSTALTFLVYLVYLHLRIAGWQGRSINRILLVAFLCVMVSLVSLMGPGQFHR